MRLEEALRKHGGPRDDFERGYIEGLEAYSWWKNGERFVGSTGRLLGDAVDSFLESRRQPAREDESWTGPSGTVYPYDPREAYDLDDPKRLGPGGYW